jgi:hypothetical protein
VVRVILLTIRCKKHRTVLATVHSMPMERRGEPIMAMRCKKCTSAIDMWNHRDKYGDLVKVEWQEVAALIDKAQANGKEETYPFADPGNAQP